MIACTCLRSCKIDECVCLKNNLKCTHLCKLQTCTNQASIDEDTVELDSDSSADSDTDNKNDV